MGKRTEEFIRLFSFEDDKTKAGRIISTAKIGDVYMSRVTIDPGVTIGNYYNKKTNTMFYVESGEVEAVFEQVKTKERLQKKIPAGRKAIHIPVYVSRAIKNIGKEKAILVFFSNHRIRSGDDFEYPLEMK